MRIVEANIEQADIVGRVHSEAWKQAYANMFAEEYLNEDTPEKRKQEFLESYGCKDVIYYIVYESDMAVGVVKVVDASDTYEIASFYILERYRGKGYGKHTIVYLKNTLDKKRMQLWVLEDNTKARRFYENNGFKNTGNTRMIYRGNSYMQFQYEFLPDVWAYEMYYDKEMCEMSNIVCLPFEEEYFAEYMSIYNECFYDMRKALDIEPYNWYSKYDQIADKKENV